MFNGKTVFGQIVFLGLLAAILSNLDSHGVQGQPATQTESPGLSELDEAMRLKATSTGLRDLNKVIERVGVAIDKGLDLENNDFAEQLLSESLMERASTLMRVINTRSLEGLRVRKIRALIVSDLRRVVSYDDPLPEAYLMLGRLMAAGGDPHEARSAIEKYLKSEEIPPAKHAEALVIRARLIKDATRALKDIQAAIEFVPENIQYRTVLVLFLRQMKNYDEAHNELDEIISLNPENANAFVLQGEIYQLQKRYDEALASFDQATKLAPLSPGPYQNRGAIYHLQEKYEEAIKQFSEVLKLQPAGVIQPAGLLAMLLRADAYRASGKLPEALADIETVLSNQNQPADATRSLHASILVGLGKINETIEEMESIAAATPDQPELKMELALYYLANKQPSKAIAAYSEVLDSNQNNPGVLRARGDLYLSSGKHAEAIVDLQQALLLLPEDTSLLNNLAWVLATSPADELRDGKRALDLATKACEATDYNTPHILSTLAAAYAEMGSFETAMKWSQKAVSLEDPVHGEQLKKELESYREGKPWREQQAMEEKTEDVPVVEDPQDVPSKFSR